MSCIQPMLVRNKNGYLVRIPCGKCYGCLRRKQRELGLRINYDIKSPRCFLSLFITLTYDDDHLIYNYVSRETGEIFPLPSVTKEDAQRFLKRLRKNLNYDAEQTKMYYYLSGEYGDETKRPHMHAIIYFLGTDTLQMDIKTAIKKSWKKCQWKQVNEKKCIQGINSDGALLYVAKHQMKKCQGTPLQSPFFQLRSKGIGSEFFKNETEIKFAKDNNYLVFDRNKKAPIPRYFAEKIGIVHTDGEIRKDYLINLEKENIAFEQAFKYYRQSHPNVTRETFAKKYYKKLIKDSTYNEQYNQIMYNKFKNAKI